MTQRYLLFDAGCLVCSSVAHAIEKATAGWLVARSLSDQEAQKQLTQAKPNWTWEPTLLEIESGHISAYTGMHLRLKLLGGLGPQRTWQTIQLMREAMEPTTIMNPQRRKFFTRTSAIAAGLLLGIGVGPLASKGHAQITGPKSIPQFQATSLSPDLARQQLAYSQTFQEAINYLGSPNWEQVYAYQSSDSNLKGLILFFPSKEKQSSTFLAIDDPSASLTTIALVGQVISTGQDQIELRWKTHIGTPLATQMFQNGKTTTLPVPQPVQAYQQMRPDFNISCFISCLGANVDADCGLNCASCLLLGPINGVVSCIQCGICAGPKGVSCARQCP